ncbi:type IV secretion system protein VirB2 [Rhizobium sp. BK619]|nr:TrbC/VirB2 family protein [Rhizobium sp. BK619]MBB3643879.1 type IV secretion system protein VirB2 [Rhizobium sp. BK619]
MITTATLRPVAARALMAVALAACLAEPAFAQAAGVETVLQNIVDMLTGNIARLLAVIAVIIICIAWIPGCRRPPRLRHQKRLKIFRCSSLR